MGAPGQVRPPPDAGPASLGPSASGGRPIAGGAQVILGRCARAVKALLPSTVFIGNSLTPSAVGAPEAPLGPEGHQELLRGA